ncbi:MAG: hypothetical protein EBR09_15140 [Proteobacteria bacterium]|nr:hypothetical protein [Pseudomonadota bacterium]
MFVRFSFVCAAVIALTTVAPAPALASDVALTGSEPRFCADMMSSVFHPQTGEEFVTRDLCEYNDLIEQGYLPEKPKKCAQTFGYVLNKKTGDVAEYKSSCELEALMGAGYQLLLRKPR